MSVLNAIGRCDIKNALENCGFQKVSCLRDFQEHMENFHLLGLGHISRLNFQHSPYDGCAGYLGVFLVAFEGALSALCPGRQTSMDATPSPSGFQLGSTNGRDQQESGGQPDGLYLCNPESVPP